MYETYATAVGRVITPVGTRQSPDGVVRASFRVACNERRYDRSGGGWVDGDSLYLSVTCWRALAENVHASLSVGDPVVVRGRLFTRQYDKDGRRNSVVEMEATTVGPDLTRCTAALTRTRRGGAAAGSEAPAAGGTADPVQASGGWRSGPLVGPDGGEVPGRQEVVEAAVGA